MDILTSLSAEMQLAVLRYCNACELLPLRQVSSNWKRISQDKMLWTPIVQKMPFTGKREGIEAFYHSIKIQKLVSKPSTYSLNQPLIHRLSPAFSESLNQTLDEKLKKTLLSLPYGTNAIAQAGDRLLIGGDSLMSYDLSQSLKEISFQYERQSPFRIEMIFTPLGQNFVTVACGVNAASNWSLQSEIAIWRYSQEKALQSDTWRVISQGQNQVACNEHYIAAIGGKQEVQLWHTNSGERVNNLPDAIKDAMKQPSLFHQLFLSGKKLIALARDLEVEKSAWGLRIWDLNQNAFQTTILPVPEVFIQHEVNNDTAFVSLEEPIVHVVGDKIVLLNSLDAQVWDLSTLTKMANWQIVGKLRQNWVGSSGFHIFFIEEVDAEALDFEKYLNEGSDFEEESVEGSEESEEEAFHENSKGDFSGASELSSQSLDARQPQAILLRLIIGNVQSGTVQRSQPFLAPSKGQYLPLEFAKCSFISIGNRLLIHFAGSPFIKVFNRTTGEFLTDLADCDSSDLYHLSLCASINHLISFRSSKSLDFSKTVKIWKMIFPETIEPHHRS